MPSPVFAAPPPTVVVAGSPDSADPSDRAKKLAEALVTEKDLPRGFKKQDDSLLVEMFREMLGERRPNADPCAIPAKAEDGSAKGQDGSGKATDDVPSRPPAVPVKTAEPKPEPVEPVGPPSAAALFLNEKKGMVAVETLAAVGEETAAGMLADLDVVLEKCPVVEAEGVTMKMRPLDWDPPLGDDSRTVGMVMAMEFDGAEMTMRGKLAHVTYRDVSMVVGLIGATDPEDRHLKKITNAAVRNLVTSTGIFAPEDTRKP